MVEQKTPDVQLRIVANADLSVVQRCSYLDTLLHCYVEPFSLFAFGRRRPHLNSIPQFCEFALRSPHSDQALLDGVQAILDYLSLGRASQPDPTTGSDVLLRPTTVSSEIPDGDTLLRGSAPEEQQPATVETLYVRFMRALGLG